MSEKLSRMNEEHVERIFHKGKLCALIIRASLPANGHQFFSDLEAPLQIGVVRYQEGEEVGRHYHPDIQRTIFANQETLYIESGGGSFELFDDDGTAYCSREVKEKDIVAFVHGAHKLKFHRETKVIQVKQGPYVGPEKDKIYF